MKDTNFNRKEIEKLILNGSFVKNFYELSNKDINYFLYFSYKNNKYQAFEILLSNWNSYCFNNDKNILTLLINNIFNEEKIIFNKIKNDILIENKYLNFYQEKIDKINIPDPSFSYVFDLWEDLFLFKKNENLSNNLNKILIGNKLNKLVKI